MARERNRPVRFVDVDPQDWAAVQHFEWVEPKLDGHWARVELDGRRWTIYSSTDRIVERGQLATAHKATTLWGEHIRGTEWSRRPHRAELYENIAVFAAPRIKGQPCMPHADITRDLLNQWLLAYKNDPFIQRLFMIERQPAGKAKAMWKHFVEKDDYEGLVFGGMTLARMKARAAYDYVCMGFEQSDSDRFSGWAVKSVVGGLYVNGKLERVTTVSGLTDDQRGEFYRNPKRYTGKVFEAEGKRLFSSGKLRHPNFLRWRSDKPATACVPPQKG